LAANTIIQEALEVTAGLEEEAPLLVLHQHLAPADLTVQMAGKEQKMSPEAVLVRLPESLANQTENFTLVAEVGACLHFQTRLSIAKAVKAVAGMVDGSAKTKACP
jgi:hypothetical protein